MSTENTNENRNAVEIVREAVPNKTDQADSFLVHNIAYEYFILFYNRT